MQKESLFMAVVTLVYLSTILWCLRVPGCTKYHLIQLGGTPFLEVFLVGREQVQLLVLMAKLLPLARQVIRTMGQVEKLKSIFMTIIFQNGILCLELYLKNRI